MSTKLVNVEEFTIKIKDDGSIRVAYKDKELDSRQTSSVLRNLADLERTRRDLVGYAKLINGELKDESGTS